MTATGVICEYNPFHIGHEKQLRIIRQQRGENTPIVCVMSGNFVQRGEPAVFHKLTRAKAAVLCGADLVLELPVTKALSSAEGFAAGGVEILGKLACVDTICFGCETCDSNRIMSTAKALLEPQFEQRLRKTLQEGISYAAAREKAMADETLAACLKRPNDILAVEYCKAILKQRLSLGVLAIAREGDYSSEQTDAENPSAMSLRRAIAQNEAWQPYVPKAAQRMFTDATRYCLQAGERAMLSRLRAMSDAEFERLPYGSEGLWHRFARACRTQPSVEAILAATKSKRYAYSRLCRMLMCAYLGISAEQLAQPISYVRVLAFNERGRALLREIKRKSALTVIDAGQTPEDSDAYALECRCSDLYALFAEGETDFPCGEEQSLRNFYAENENNTCKK